MTAARPGPLDGSPYQAYLYAYPHKTAYRPFDPPIRLVSLWEGERRDALSLYVHIPFCGMRCGFCNLFTRAGARERDVAGYLDALRRQAERVRTALGEATRFARFAVGGGTPTFLDAADLGRVLDLAERVMGADLPAVPCSVEVSPGTVDEAKLALLVGRGIDRISIGVETFDEAEAAAVYRPQPAGEVERALGLIRDAGVPTLNVDLIYGLPGQDEASWARSLHAALAWRPEEMYLYPLYVRPLTGLGRSDRSWDDLRLACYRLGRDLLREAGYRQVSMRMFRRLDAPDAGGPAYCCQEDGMVGLGCGARSYTRSVHYGSEYAVGATGVRQILESYVRRSPEEYEVADFGRSLDPEDQRRRFVIQSLLQAEGLSLAAFARRFGSQAWDDLSELGSLEPLGLARREQDRLVLTPAGLERSDAIGPWLVSEPVRRDMEAYAWR